MPCVMIEKTPIPDEDLPPRAANWDIVDESSVIHRVPPLSVPRPRRTQHDFSHLRLSEMPHEYIASRAILNVIIPGGMT